MTNPVTTTISNEIIKVDTLELRGDLALAQKAYFPILYMLTLQNAALRLDQASMQKGARLFFSPL